MSASPSHRSTTSSRYPGREFSGTVWKTRIIIVRCEECGQPRYVFGSNVHHIVTRTPDCAEGESIDCQGRKVSHR